MGACLIFAHLDRLEYLGLGLVWVRLRDLAMGSGSSPW
jgi:hypothetical protein